MAVTNYAALGVSNDSASGSTNDSRTFIAKTLILLAKWYLRFYDIADKQKLPNNSSKTMQFSKYPDLNLPYATLTEGSDPTPQAMSNTYVTATIEQWGNVIQVTDIAELTIAHPVMQIAQDLLARQAARVIDRELQKVVNAGSNVYYATGVSARTSLTTSTKATAADIRAIVARLRDNGAEPADGEFYVGVVDPAVEAELFGETTFINANAYAGNLKTLMMGEVGSWMGVRWIRSNFIPYLERTTAASLSAAGTGTLSDGTYHFEVVAKLVTTGQERLVCVNNSITLSGGGAAQAVTVATPSSTDYLYDIYCGTSASTMYLSSSNNAGATNVVVTAMPSASTVAPTVPAASVKVHRSYVFGKGSFACVDLQNLSFHMTPKGPMVGAVLELSRYIGWKAAFKAVILNGDFMYRLESHSDYT